VAAAVNVREWRAAAVLIENLGPACKGMLSGLHFPLGIINFPVTDRMALRSMQMLEQMQLMPGHVRI
jgi:hypothetical protein